MLILLLLLLLLAHPLQLLDDFLGRPRLVGLAVGVLAGSHGRTGWRGHLLGRVIVDGRLVIFFGREEERWASWASVERCCAQSIRLRPRRSRARCAHHEEVITGSVEQLGQDVPRVAGSVDAENALVFVHPVDGHAAGGGDVLEDLRQAGIVRFYRQLSAGKADPRRLSGLVRREGGRDARCSSRSNRAPGYGPRGNHALRRY